MRKKIIFTLLFIFIYPLVNKAQIQNVIVETYYISDADDATDSTNYLADPAYPSPILPAGSKTYRVFIELKPGSKLRKIYGSNTITYHPLIISSTEEFWNNVDRATAYFGYNIYKSWIMSNPTIALDSWLTLGLATTTQSGILKTEDSNGCLPEILNNYGGTAAIQDGLLMNSQPGVGIPLSVKDGLVPNTFPLGQWAYSGFVAYDSVLTQDVDTTIFGVVKRGSHFVGTDVLLQQTPGIMATADSNKILVAQLTTLGEISFELNVEVEVPDGASTNIINYVASGVDTSYELGTLVVTERVSPWLTYPPVCGCTDANYLEYSSAYACNNADSCITRIVFGCMDPLACNFKADANLNIPELCCYPGYCKDRDIALVCPVLSTKKILLYPNPANDVVTLQISSLIDDEKTRYAVYDSYGRLMLEKNINISSGTSTIAIDISTFSKGVYMFRLYSGENSESRMFLKD